MKKYLALVVDDNPDSVEQLTRFIEQTDLFAKPYVCTTSTQAVAALYEHSFDLLFLDIELPDMSALDLLRMFPKRPPVCAISAHPAYAVDCFDLDIEDFMVKPLNYPRFLRSLRRSLLHTSDEPVAPQPVQGSPDQPVTLPQTHIYLKTGRQVTRFAIEDIMYLEAFHIYSKLITSDSSFVINEQISKLEQRLMANNFIRIHKSFLIDLNKVTKYEANTIWVGNYKLPIGGVYKNKLQERLKILGII